MAERGAHLTATSHAKPSIFEVVAQDSLSVTFHPALKRVATFLASCNPERYGWLVGWFEEVYFAFNTILQYYYLRCHGASFAEAFYGLQRMPLRGILPRFPRLPPREEAVSLLCLCVVPYLRAKLEDRVTQCQLQGTSQGWLRLHSALHSVWESCVLGNYLCYMSGSAASHSPLLCLAGVMLQYAPEQKHESRFPFLSAKFVGYLLTRTLEFGAFFLQFLQWWHSEDKLRTSLTALPIPPPFEIGETECEVDWSDPEEPNDDDADLLGFITTGNYLNSSRLNDWSALYPVASYLVSAKARHYGGVCPICLQNWKIETVLSVSGFVFCYRCIVQYLRDNHCCPVTKYPADVGDLIRIYSSHS